MLPARAGGASIAILDSSRAFQDSGINLDHRGLNGIGPADGVPEQPTGGGADPERFFVPPYVGHKGWVGMRLDKSPDWNEVQALVRRSYRLIAPRRLAALVD